MKHIFLGVVICIVLLTTGLYFSLIYKAQQKQASAPETQNILSLDAKNLTYIIDGNTVKLTNGESTQEAAPGSASQIVTKYFGNEVVKDINGDGKDDTVFLLTQDRGGSGTFFYVVAAVTTESGLRGTHGLLLGDRIAPQTTEKGDSKTVIVNYAERRSGESMSESPSVGKSIKLLLDTDTLQFGEVVQNFEGEADTNTMKLPMKPWNFVTALYNDGKEVKLAADMFSITFTDSGTFTATTDCNQLFGSYETNTNALTFKGIGMTKKFCENSQEQEFVKLLENTSSYHFTSKGQLIFDLKYDSGTVTFR